MQQSWGKSATVENATSGFRSTGIMPFNPTVVPDYAFTPVQNTPEKGTSTNRESIATSVSKVQESTPQSSSTAEEVTSTSTPREPGPSQQSTFANKKETPSKFLMELSPVASKVEVVRKRAKQVTTVLTSTKHLDLCKEKEQKKETAEKKRLSKKASVKSSKRMKIESSSSDEEEPELESDDSGRPEINENECVGCGEDYNKTKKKVDWIRCIRCQFWLHDDCTSYSNLCQTCGKLNWKGKGIKKINN